MAAALARRLAAGDASALEAGIAAGDAERERALALLAEARATAARLTLRSRFPELDGRSQQAPTSTVPPEHERAHLASDHLEASPELALARAERQRSESAFARSLAALRSEPSVGAYSAVDRGGAERVLGLTLSVPLAGAARDARVREAAAERDAAGERVQEVERRLRAAFSQLWTDAGLRSEAAQALARAAQAQAQAAARVGRAWELGEASLAEWLLARRTAGLAHEQALAAAIETTAAAAHLALELDRLPAFASPAQATIGLDRKP